MLCHGYGGRGITNCAEPTWKCRSACAEHSGQTLLPVVVRRFVKSDRQRKSVVNESEKHGINVPKFVLAVIREAKEHVY